ncbi:kinase domain-containing protein [Coniochaeta sp. 2T2.1]|nr:kinase domain-containing protein [Coniochaeta sp. 2T2.1]
MWWDSNLIEATVTRQFVCGNLLPEEIKRLDQPLGFGDGLTDGTYWEWIDEKAKRIFLVLVDLGVPDQIFGVIDDSWDDEDLPIALDQVECLALTPAKDLKFERKFYYRQFHYLLKPLQKGEHIDYDDFEIVPLDVVDRKQGLAVHHSTDKVVLPNHPGVSLCRRRIPLGSGPGCMEYEDFLYEVNSIRTVQNEHLVSYFASYTHQGYAYVLLTPVSDYTLKSFLATTPATFKNLPKRNRREHVLNWIHCLVDTVCFLHHRGLSHGNIKPSTVLLNHDNHIFLSDFSRLNPDLLGSSTTSEHKPSSFDKESYDYAAPEQWFRPTTVSSSSSSRPVSGQFSFSTAGAHRRPTLASLSSSPPDKTTFSISRANTTTLTDHVSSHAQPPAFHAQPTPQLSPQAADIFSLACVILELLTFLLKKPSRGFATHRGARHKTPGRGGAVPDSSFHKNLGQVEGWMTTLAKEAGKKGSSARDDGGGGLVFRGVAPMLRVVEGMLALHPAERPAARDVQARMYEILHDVCGVAEPHCVHQYRSDRDTRGGGWEVGIGRLRLGEQEEVEEEEETANMVLGSTRSSSGRVGGFGGYNTRAGSSGGRGSLAGSIAGSSTSSGGSSAGYEFGKTSVPTSPRLRPEEIGPGLQAIQKLRVRNDSNARRQWQPAVGVGY